MRSTPYGIDALDVTSFEIGAILLMGVAGLASWLPARRSARVDPMVALRSE
jgi:ABC-type antimicrobial peptide transport system permease subunit